MSQAIENIIIGKPTIEIVNLFPRQGEWTEADYFRLPESNQDNRTIRREAYHFTITNEQTSENFK